MPPKRTKKDGTRWFYSTPKKKQKEGDSSVQPKKGSPPEAAADGSGPLPIAADAPQVAAEGEKPKRTDRKRGAKKSQKDKERADGSVVQSRELVAARDFRDASDFGQEVEYLRQVAALRVDDAALDKANPKVHGVKMVDMVNPVSLSDLPRSGADLNIAPPNYLREDPTHGVHRYAPDYQRDRPGTTASLLQAAITELQTARLEGAKAEESSREAVNVITTSNALKQMFTAGHSDDPLMLSVTRYGPAIFVDEPEGLRSTTTVDEARSRSLTAKAMYHAAHQEMLANAPPKPAGTASNTDDPVVEGSAVRSPVLAGVIGPKKPSGGELTPKSPFSGLTTGQHLPPMTLPPPNNPDETYPAPAASRFNAVQRWGLDSLDVLLGSDTPLVYDEASRTLMMLRVADADGGRQSVQIATPAPIRKLLKDTPQAKSAAAAMDGLFPEVPEDSPQDSSSSRNISNIPLNRGESLSWWFDAILANVRDIAVCIHRNGIIQDYQIIPAQEILGFVEKLEARRAMNFTGSVLEWLEKNCVEEGQNYIVMRSNEDQTLRLFECGQDPQFYGASANSAPSSNRKQSGRSASGMPTGGSRGGASGRRATTATPIPPGPQSVVDELVGPFLLKTALSLSFSSTKKHAAQALSLGKRGFKTLLAHQRHRSGAEAFREARRSLCDDEELLLSVLDKLPDIVRHAAAEAAESARWRPSKPGQAPEENIEDPFADDPDLTSVMKDLASDMLNPDDANPDEIHTNDDEDAPLVRLSATATKAFDSLDFFADALIHTAEVIPAGSDPQVDTTIQRLLVGLARAVLTLNAHFLNQYTTKMYQFHDIQKQQGKLSRRDATPKLYRMTCVAVLRGIVRGFLAVQRIHSLLLQRSTDVGTPTSPTGAPPPTATSTGKSVSLNVAVSLAPLTASINEMYLDIALLVMEDPSRRTGDILSAVLGPYREPNKNIVNDQGETVPSPDNFHSSVAIVVGELSKLSTDIVATSFQALRHLGKLDASSKRLLLKKSKLNFLVGQFYAEAQRQTKASEALQVSSELYKASQRAATSDEPFAPTRDIQRFSHATIQLKIAMLNSKVALLHSHPAQQAAKAPMRLDVGSLSLLELCGRVIGVEKGVTPPLSEMEENAWRKTIDLYNEVLSDLKAAAASTAGGSVRDERNKTPPPSSAMQPGVVHDANGNVEAADVQYLLGEATLRYARRIIDTLWCGGAMPSSLQGKDIVRAVEELLGSCETLLVGPIKPIKVVALAYEQIRLLVVALQEGTGIQTADPTARSQKISLWVKLAVKAIDKMVPAHLAGDGEPIAVTIGRRDKSKGQEELLHLAPERKWALASMLYGTILSKHGGHLPEGMRASGVHSQLVHALHALCAPVAFNPAAPHVTHPEPFHVAAFASRSFTQLSLQLISNGQCSPAGEKTLKKAIEGVLRIGAQQGKEMANTNSGDMPGSKSRMALWQIFGDYLSAGNS